MTDTTVRPKRTPIKSDKQLKTTEAVHNMYMSIVVKWCIAFLFMAVLIAIVILVTAYVVNHQEYVRIIADQFFNNMGAIFVAIAVFLGLKKFPSEDNI